MTEIVLHLLILFSFSSLTALLGLVVWSRSRDLAWLLVVVASMTWMAGFIYKILKQLGILEEMIRLNGLPMTEIGLESLPFIFLVLAFIVMIYRQRR